MNKSTLYSFYLIIFLSFSSHAQEKYSSGLIGNDIKSNAITDIEDQFFQCSLIINCPISFKIKNTKLYTKLWFEEDIIKQFPNSEWQINVEYTIDLYNIASGWTTNVNGSQKLSVHFNPDGNYKDIDIALFKPLNNIPQNQYNAAKVKITNVEVQKLTPTSTIPPFDVNSISKKIHFDLELEVDRWIDYSQQGNINIPIIRTGNYDVAKNELNFNWDFIHGAIEYDFEYLVLEGDALYFNNPIKYEFKNATRITTKNNFYNVSMAYPESIILFRYRPVGEEQTGLEYKRSEGKWSAKSFGLTSLSGSMYPNSLMKKHLFLTELGRIEAFHWEGHEVKKNWQYSAVFAEDGKKKEVIQYSNGLLMEDQSVTVLNTDNTAIIKQPIRDWMGRESLNILPAPQNSKGIQYYDKLHFNNTYQEYSYTDFDFDNNINKPEPLSPFKALNTDNFGAGNYYSEKNKQKLGINHDFVPNAGGYPFTRTIFLNDGTGRVKEQTGIGKAGFFDGGTDQNQINHSTKYFYDVPDQTPLLMLFGNNVGFKSYYERTIAVSPNGQASAVYKDLSGRVIATSLIGDPPDNLTAIDTKPDNYPKITEDLNPPSGIENQRVDNKLIINNKFTSVIGVYEFEYKLPGSVFEDCLTKDCVYDITIKVLDEFGEIARDKQGNLVPEFNQTARKSTIIKFSADLALGSYQIVKILELNEENLDAVVDEFYRFNTDETNANRCYSPEIVDPIDCEQNCEEACKSQYISPENDGVSQLFDDEGNIIGTRQNNINTFNDSSINYDYIFSPDPNVGKIAACIKTCKDNDYTDLEDLPNECDIKYDLLKTDMSKGGQYFDNLPSFDPNGYDKNKWLVDNLSRVEIQNIKRCLGIQVDVLGTNNLWDYLRTNWKSEWGDVLIQYHPEYCLFKSTCCSEGCASNGKEIPNSIDLTYNYCYSTSVEDQAKIDEYIQAKIDDPNNNYDVQEAQIQASIDDTALHPYFTAEKLEERERAFYKDYFKYHAIRKACDSIDEPNLYIEGDDGYGGSYNGFQIRYPVNDLYENFDPENPTSIQDSMKKENCELEAQVLTSNFMNNFNCKDLLNRNELKQLEKDIYETALKNCEKGLNYNMSAKIEDFLCGYSLPKSCYGSALPEPTKGSCECDNIFNFVQGVLVDNGAIYNFPEDLYNEPTLADAPSVQNALDIYLADASLKPEFSNWFKNCQTNANWYGSNDPVTYPIDDSFSCYNFGPDEDDTNNEEDCGTDATAYMQLLKNIRFEAEMRAKAQQFKLDYIESCLANANEEFTKEYEFKEYHFTLFYYDQAGNLTQTVPPAGIYQLKPNGTVLHNSLLKDISLTNQPLTDAINYLYGNSTDFIWPEHVMYTNYQYNSLNAVENQLMPDHGDPNNPITQVTKFYYDALGRLIVSQNPYQKNISNYSYMVYDDLGRTIEAGQMQNTAIDKTIATNLTFLHTNNPSDDLYTPWFTGGVKNEYTKTQYDTKATTSNLVEPQNHLRNRIAMVSNFEDGINPSFATHYSYDVLGNVVDVWQENYDLKSATTTNPNIDHSFKHFDYEFDIISGNVNQVNYQKGYSDHFSHKYLYDADNRITHSFTSTNDIIWNNDATYFYYAHGPLARVEIGQNKVFGDDYFYSIAGWLTGKNASTLNEKRDIGMDGVRNSINENVGLDPFAFSLHYFEDHYKPIGNRQDVLATLNNTDHTKAATNLYNGNIPNMIVSMRDLEGKPMDVMDYQFEYDQLQRIKKQIPLWDKNTNSPLGNNEFRNTSNQLGDFNLETTFDGNGNLMTLKRNGTDTYLKMDDFGYKFNTYTTNAGNARKNNQLVHLDENAATNNYDLDIEKDHDYEYDVLGRLVNDPAEDIAQINWNVSNKVTSIIKTIDPMNDQNVNLRFGYGPMGNRTLKVVEKKDTQGNLLPEKDWKRTWYVLDAQGNPMAVYEYQKDSNGVLQLVLKELTIYGADRLGTKNQNNLIYEK